MNTDNAIRLIQHVRSLSCSSLILLIILWAQSSMATIPMLPVGKTIQLTPQIFIIPDQRIPLVPNVGILIGNKEVMVIDTGMGPANAEIVLSEVRKLTDKPVRYLVSTHFHPEHNFGAQSFPEETIIIYSSNQEKDLREKGKQYLDLFIQLFGDDVRPLLENVKLVAPDVTFESRAKINLGNLPVELIHLGKAAHTRGDTLIFLPAQKILFSGGLTPNKFFPIMPDADSNGNDWIASLEEIEKLDANTIIPGHGDVGNKQLITTVKNYLLKLRARVKQLKTENKSIEKIKEILFPEFKAQHPDWDEPHWINNAIDNFYSR